MHCVDEDLFTQNIVLLFISEKLLILGYKDIF